MKLKSLCFGLLFLLGLAFPSYSQNTSAANEIHLSLNGINDIAINYDDEEITVFTSDSNELLVKELSLIHI